MKYLFIVAVVCCLMMIVSPALGSGIHGEVAFGYELLKDSPGEEWTVDIYYEVFPWLRIGALETTITEGMWEYVFIPNMQKYEIYITVIPFKNATLKLSQWCDHPVIWQENPDNIDPLKIPDPKMGLKIIGSYKF